MSTSATYAMSLLSCTESSRFTASGFSSASTSMTCFAIEACLAEANGISTILLGHEVLETINDPVMPFMRTLCASRSPYF